MPRSIDRFTQELKEQKKKHDKMFSKPKRTNTTISKERDWFHDFRKKFDTEEAMFNKVNVDRKLFYDVLQYVQDVPLKSAGRASYFKSHKSKLLLLMTYL